jgi:hypothetical protein
MLLGELNISDSLFPLAFLVASSYSLVFSSTPVASDVRMPFENRRLILSSLAVAALFLRVSAFLKPMRYPAFAAVRACGSMPKNFL